MVLLLVKPLVRLLFGSRITVGTGLACFIVYSIGLCVTGDSFILTGIFSAYLRYAYGLRALRTAGHLTAGHNTRT